MKFSTLASIGAVVNGKLLISGRNQAITTDFNCQFKLKDSAKRKKVNGAAGHPGYHVLEHVALEPEHD